MSDADRPVSVEVRRGSPTAEELAAVVAVVAETYAQELATQTVDEVVGVDAWQRSARGLRQPLDRGAGWGRFSG